MKKIGNRVIRTELIEWRNLEWLQNKNLKELKKDSFNKLKLSIINNNFIQPFNVWKNNKKVWILDGHHRKRAMEELEKEGYSIPKILPANFIECKDRKEAVKLILIYSAIYANVTEEGLYEFLNVEKLNFDDLKLEIDLPKIDLRKFGEGYYAEPDEKADDVPPIPQEAKTKLGELYLLGNHRLLCGDSTKKEDVERLMDGKKADMVFTDPPYGANISGMMQEVHGSNSIIGRARRWEQIKGDEKEDIKLQEFLGKAFRCFADNSKDNAAWYIWHAMLTQGFFSTAADADLLLHRQIIWVKPCLILAFGHYHWRHELCFYGWKRGYKPNFYGEKNSNTVWEMDYDGKGRMPKDDRKHVTQKPVNLSIKAINNSSLKGEIIIDGFLGSGSTLIACEKTDRICYGVEIDPHYCDVILDRWANYTLKDPVREDGIKWSEIKNTSDVNLSTIDCRRLHGESRGKRDKKKRKGISGYKRQS